MSHLYSSIVSYEGLFRRFKFLDVLLEQSNNFMPSLYIASTDIRIAKAAFRLLEKCVHPFTQILKVFCMNRARQRRRIFHLVRDFENLQQELEEIEYVIHQMYIETTDSALKV